MSNTIVTVRYVDNGSARYDSKEFQESLFKIRRDKNTSGSLKTRRLSQSKQSRAYEPAAQLSSVINGLYITTS